jgi:Flp pilus assembly protein TadG
MRAKNWRQISACPSTSFAAVEARSETEVCSASKSSEVIRTKCRRAGTAIIEFTLCAPLLLGLALGTIQFGYSYYMYGELEQSVRAAGRYASLRPYGSATTTPDAAYLTAVQNVAVYANPTGGTTPIVKGLTTANVGVTMTFTNGVPSAVAVKILNFALPQIFPSAPLANKPYVKFPYLGLYQPPVT